MRAEATLPMQSAEKEQQLRAVGLRLQRGQHAHKRSPARFLVLILAGVILILVLYTAKLHGVQVSPTQRWVCSVSHVRMADELMQRCHFTPTISDTRAHTCVDGICTYVHVCIYVYVCMCACVCVRVSLNHQMCQPWSWRNLYPPCCVCMQDCSVGRA